MSNAFKLPTFGSSKPFGLTLDVKKSFFDRDLVLNKVGAATAKKLSRIGGTIRLIARRSMKFNKRGTPSLPGKPPRYHTKNENASLRKILFALNPDQQGVVIGPVKLNFVQFDETGVLKTGTVPAVQEFGGSVGIREKLIPMTWRDAVRRFGQEGGKHWVSQAGLLSEDAAKRIYGKAAVHRIDHSQGGVWVPAGRKRRDRIVTRVRKANYPARPYMAPALAKHLPKIPEEFKGMVSNG